MKKTINLILLILFIICSFSIILAQKNKKADYKKSYGNTTVDSINYSIDTSKISIDSLKNHLKLISSDEKKEFRKAKLLIEAQYKGDSVVLRWAVDTPGGWVTANRAGYMLSRIDLSNNKKELLTRQPMFPWSIEKWKEMSAPNDGYAAIAAQCLYGSLTAGNPSQAKDANDFVQNLKYAAVELSNKHGFALFAADMDAHAANGLALRYVDKDVKKNRNYIYTIEIAEPDSTYIIEQAAINISTDSETPAPSAPSDFRAGALDSKVELKWTADDLNGFTAYNLYKINDVGELVKLNFSPIVPMMPADSKLQNNEAAFTASYIDSNLINYKEYTYCLKGITSFAEESPCASVKAKPVDLTAPKAPKLQAKQITRSWLKLYWDNKEKESDLAGYIVLKSSDIDNDYHAIHEEILPPVAKEVVDSFAVDTQPYYVIYALDTAGNISRSIPLTASIVDTVPPSKPEGLTGTIDTLGRVELKWELGPEDNLKGYRVYRSNDPKHEFTQIVPKLATDTEYKDSVTLNTLTSRVYYRVAAINNRNSVSELSDILELKRPDKIPPQPAVITAFSAVDSVIIVKWNISSSEDLEKQIVRRRKFGDEKWNYVDTLMADENGYYDFNGDENTFFEYSILSLDSSGNSSPSANIVKLKKLNLKIDEAVENLKAKYDPNSNEIILNWDFKPVKAHDYWISIMRGYSSGNGIEIEPRYYDAVQKTIKNFKDHGIIGKGKYKYILKIASNDGISKIEKEIEVEVK